MTPEYENQKELLEQLEKPGAINVHGVTTTIHCVITTFSREPCHEDITSNTTGNT